MGSSCHCTSSPVAFAAAFITLTASGTTSKPISSPSRMPIFTMLSAQIHDVDALKHEASLIHVKRRQEVV